MARSDLHWVSTEIPLSNTAHRSENRGRDRRKRAQTRQPSRGPRLCCPHCGNDSIELWIPAYAVYRLETGSQGLKASAMPEFTTDKDEGDIPYLYCPNCNHEEEAPERLIQKINFTL
jgi:hypothetical protein